MKFHDYLSLHGFFGKQAAATGLKLAGPIPFYEAVLQQIRFDDVSRLRNFPPGDPAAAAWGRDGSVAREQILSELAWYEAGQPYYNVYPNITKHLIRVHEEKIPVEYIKLPEKSLVFRFAESDATFRTEWRGKNYQLLSMLVSSMEEMQSSEKVNNYLIWMDFGERMNGEPIHIYRKLVMRPGYTVEQAMSELADDTETLSFGVQVPQEVIDNAVRCVISCSLISHDLEEGLIEPDVLAKDRVAWDRTHDPKYVERAIRRGKKSWNVGARMTDIAPSYRSPSPLALYWTGTGRTIPLLRNRRGTWVKRKKIAEIPHGYLGDE